MVHTCNYCHRSGIINLQRHYARCPHVQTVINVAQGQKRKKNSDNLSPSTHPTKNSQESPNSTCDDLSYTDQNINMLEKNESLSSSSCDSSNFLMNNVSPIPSSVSTFNTHITSTYLISSSPLARAYNAINSIHLA